MRLSQATLQSVGWYVGLVLLVGQFAARVFAAVPLDKGLLLITGVLIFGPMYGPDFVVKLVSAVRGANDGNERRDR